MKMGFLSTGNDRYSVKNGQGFLFHCSGCLHYSGRLLYGTQHISLGIPNISKVRDWF